MTWTSFVAEEWPDERAPATWTVKLTGKWWIPYQGTAADGAPEFRGSVDLWVPKWLSDFHNDELRSRGEEPSSSNLWWATGWTGSAGQVLQRCFEEMRELEDERDKEMERVGFMVAAQGFWP